jgi:hypothetical protein
MAAVGVAAGDDDDGNAGQGRREDNSWRDEPRRDEARTQKVEPPKPGHHASWNADRAPFCAAIQRLGREYDDIAKWLVANGKPRPSAMTVAQRQELYAFLENLGSKDLPDTVSAREAK